MGRSVIPRAHEIGESVVALHSFRNPVFLPVRAPLQSVSFAVVRELLGDAIEMELRLANPIRGVGEVDKTGTVVGLLDIGVGLFTRAQTFNEVGLMRFVREIPLILVDHLPALDHHLPAAPMAAQIHEALRPVDLHPGCAGGPVGPFVTETHFARKLAHVAGCIATFAGH